MTDGNPPTGNEPDTAVEIQRQYEAQVKEIERKNEYIMFLNETRRSTTENMAKAILTFSSTGIIASIAVLRLLGPNDLSSGISIFLAAIWVLFGMAILLIVASYILGKWATEYEIRQVKDPKHTSPWEDAIEEAYEWPLYASAICFSLGIVFFVLLGFLMV